MEAIRSIARGTFDVPVSGRSPSSGGTAIAVSLQTRGQLSEERQS